MFRSVEDRLRCKGKSVFAALVLAIFCFGFSWPAFGWGGIVIVPAVGEAVIPDTRLEWRGKRRDFATSLNWPIQVWPDVDSEPIYFGPALEPAIALPNGRFRFNVYHSLGIGDKNLLESLGIHNQSDGKGQDLPLMITLDTGVSWYEGVTGGLFGVGIGSYDEFFGVRLSGRVIRARDRIDRMSVTVDFFLFPPGLEPW